VVQLCQIEIAQQAHKKKEKKEMNEEKRQVNFGDGERTVTANIWERYGKKRIYFKALGSQLCWDCNTQEWISVKNERGNRQKALIEAEFKNFIEENS
jgi:hypothetical protein